MQRRALLIGAAAVAGCGFRPAYGPGGAARALQGRVRVAAPDGRLGYFLVERLEERLGRAEAPAFHLSYEIAVEEEELAVTPAQEITRVNLVGEVGFELTEAATGVVRLSGTVENFTSFDAAGSTVATVTAERDARERLMVILADSIVTRLLALEPAP